MQTPLHLFILFSQIPNKVLFLISYIFIFFEIFNLYENYMLDRVSMIDLNLRFFCFRYVVYTMPACITVSVIFSCFFNWEVDKEWIKECKNDYTVFVTSLIIGYLFIEILKEVKLVRLSIGWNFTRGVASLLTYWWSLLCKTTLGALWLISTFLTYLSFPPIIKLVVGWNFTKDVASLLHTRRTLINFYVGLFLLLLIDFRMKRH